MTAESPNFILPQERECLPVGPLPYPVKDGQIWLVAGEKAPSCPGFTKMMRLEEVSGKGYELLSFPLVFGQLTQDGLQYNFPGAKLDSDVVNEAAFRDAVCSALGLKPEPHSCFFIRESPDGNAFLVMEIVAKTRFQFLRKANDYLRQLPEHIALAAPSDVRFSKRVRSERIQEESVSDPEVKALAGEVEKKIALLMMKDYPVEIIETWLQKAVKLSRLRVTTDYRIFLTDYDREVVMRQLPKTLFFFFLKHPEGCRLKDLSDHRRELLQIYRRLTIHDDPAQIEASIDALVDPLSNSFSEKCTAIKYAFLNIVADRIARNYYIHGPQGDLKSISLDRNLVDWEVEI